MNFIPCSYEVAAELLCYRKSILAKAEIDPPKTLDGVLHAARRLTDRSRDFYGIAWCGKRGTPLAQTFLQLLADFDQPPLTFPRHLGHVDLSAAEDASLSACLETEAAFAAAEHLKALLPFSPPEVLETGWDERLYAYATGRVALAYNWSVRIGELQSSPGSPLADTGFLAHPSAFPRPGTAPLGGFGLAIPANLAPDRIDGAVRMLRWLTSPTVTKLAALNGGSSSPRITVSRDTDVAESNLVIPVIDRLARSDLIQRWSNPPIPHYSVLLKALGNELHEMLLGRTSIAHALESAQKRVNNVLGVEKG
ncbi:extracellular solute-binding protein [Rhizobium sp. LjRoot98]|uniref:extracellular solute-binding protein n=1 Tax=Rhizobium sp. LjRoot98 TaxID=3342345 RepID=UPI003ECEAA9C